MHFLRTEDELWIAELAHLRNIETGNLSFDGNALTQDDVENPVENKTEGKHEAHQRGATDDLCHQLAGISVEQASHEPFTPFHDPP
jgi:hypothetical protein